MEDLLKWDKSVVAAGDDVFEKSQTHVMSRDYSLHMKTRTTNAQANDWIKASRTCGILPTQGLTIESPFLLPTSGIPGRMWWELDWYDGTNRNIARIYYDRTNSKWRYLNYANAVTDVPDGSIDLQNGVWHWIRFSFSLHTRRYRVLMAEGQSYNLSSQGFYSPAAAGNVQLKASITIEAASASPVEVWIDNYTLSST